MLIRLMELVAVRIGDREAHAITCLEAVTFHQKTMAGMEAGMVVGL